MTFAPASLSDLAAYWRAQGGVPLGIVGNTAHTSGYHLGRDRIYDGAGPGLGAADYSVQLPRDKAGLSDAASAIDLGRLGGTLAGLRRFSEWLVAACMADRVAYRDVREVIYSTVDGVYVKRYSAPDHAVYTSLRKTADGIKTVTPGNGDASHYTHTHISFYRDSAGRDKRPLFAPFFAVPDTATAGEPVKSFAVPEQRTLAKVRDLAWLYADSSLAASDRNVRLSPARELALVGTYAAGIRIVAYEPAAPDAGSTSVAMFIREADIEGYRVPADQSPYTADDLATAEKKGWNAARAAALAAVSGVPGK